MSETQVNEAPAQPKTRPSNKPSKARRRGLTILAAVVTVGAIGYGAYWWLVARNYESTDDAYIAGDVVQITAEQPGTVLALHADDTQWVKRGQPLLELDKADAEVAMTRAEAHLADAVRRVRTLLATRDELHAQIAEREVMFRRARTDYQRRVSLAGDGAVSGEELSHTRDRIAQMRAGLDAARDQLKATEAQIDGTTIQTHPLVLIAEAAVRDAALALRRTHIDAPVAGIIAHRTVQVGQRVAAGTPLMAVVPLNDVWVDANFKEVQLEHMRVGQPVTLHADLYGGDVDYHGTLVGLSAGSGSAFALLPAQNASGNWIKIVQRVPVRIALDPKQLKAHPLRIGLSMTVRVDTRDRSGTLMAGSVRARPIPAQSSLGDDPAVEAEIARIIADNSGQPLHTADKTAATTTRAEDRS